jgi:hypothetical protein
VSLGVLGLALMAAWVPLTYLTGDVQVSRDGAALAFALVCGFVGMLVARRQPRNPEGWLLLGAAVCVVALLDSGLYAVLDYHLHHGRLPLGKRRCSSGTAWAHGYCACSRWSSCCSRTGGWPGRGNGCCGCTWS